MYVHNTELRFQQQHNNLDIFNSMQIKHDTVKRLNQTTGTNDYSDWCAWPKVSSVLHYRSYLQFVPIYIWLAYMEEKPINMVSSYPDKEKVERT